MGEGRHVRFTVLADGSRARAVAFGAGTSLPVRDGVPADATFALEVNEWRGVSEPRLVLRHARAAEASARGETAPRGGGAGPFRLIALLPRRQPRRDGPEKDIWVLFA